MTIDNAKKLDSILRFLSEKKNAEYSFNSWSDTLKELNLNNSQSMELLSQLKLFGFIKLLEFEETNIPEVAITSIGLSFVNSEQSFVKFSINITKDMVESIDNMLRECRQRGWITITYDSSKELRAAINEAKSRDWIRKKNNYSYELTPLGMDVMDFESVENYLAHKKSQKHAESTIIHQPTINAGNVIYGNNNNSINQSSSSDKIQYTTAKTKPKNKILKYIGTIILGIITWLITQYYLYPLFSGK